VIAIGEVRLAARDVGGDGEHGERHAVADDRPAIGGAHDDARLIGRDRDGGHRARFAGAAGGDRRVERGGTDWIERELPDLRLALAMAEHEDAIADAREGVDVAAGAERVDGGADGAGVEVGGDEAVVDELDHGAVGVDDGGEVADLGEPPRAGGGRGPVPDGGDVGVRARAGAAAGGFERSGAGGGAARGDGEQRRELLHAG
jgi:hypothetical protein